MARDEDSMFYQEFEDTGAKLDMPHRAQRANAALGTPDRLPQATQQAEAPRQTGAQAIAAGFGRLFGGGNDEEPTGSTPEVAGAGTRFNPFDMIGSAQASEAGADQASAAPAQALEEGLLSDEVRQAPAPIVSTPMSERGGIAPMSPDEIQRVMDYDATRRQFLEAAGTPSEVAPVRSAPGMPLPESLGELTVNERITGLPGGAEAYRQETRDGEVIYTDAPGPRPVTGERASRGAVSYLPNVAALMVPGVEQGQRAVHQARMEALRRGDRNAVQMSLRSPRQRMRDYEGRMARRQAARQRFLARPTLNDVERRNRMIGLADLKAPQRFALRTAADQQYGQQRAAQQQAYQQALAGEQARMQAGREADIATRVAQSRANLEAAQRQKALTEAAMAGGVSEGDIFREQAAERRARIAAAARQQQRPLRFSVGTGMREGDFYLDPITGRLIDPSRMLDEMLSTRQTDQ